MNYQTLILGPFETNCYIIWDAATSRAAIIDPGGDGDRIAAIVASEGLSVEWVLLTHGHLDHSYLAGEMALRYGARVGMHESDIGLLSNTLGIGEMFYDMSVHVPFTPSDLLTDGKLISLGNSQIEVLHTPGHSAGGLCFVTDVGVFCGDTVFSGSIGRTDLPGGSYEQLMVSIRSKLLVLKDSTALFPGHGPATTIGTERATNPFL